MLGVTLTAVSMNNSPYQVTYGLNTYLKPTPLILVKIRQNVVLDANCPDHIVISSPLLRGNVIWEDMRTIQKAQYRIVVYLLLIIRQVHTYVRRLWYQLWSSIRMSHQTNVFETLYDIHYTVFMIHTLKTYSKVSNTKIRCFTCFSFLRFLSFS